MTIKKFTTPEVTFALPIPYSEIEVGYFTISQNGYTVAEYDNTQWEVNGNEATVILTQKVTGKLVPRELIATQVTVLSKSGKRYTTDFEVKKAKAVLKKTEI